MFLIDVAEFGRKIRLKKIPTGQSVKSGLKTALGNATAKGSYQVSPKTGKTIRNTVTSGAKKANIARTVIDDLDTTIAPKKTINRVVGQDKIPINLPKKLKPKFEPFSGVRKKWNKLDTTTKMGIQLGGAYLGVNVLGQLGNNQKNNNSLTVNIPNKYYKPDRKLSLLNVNINKQKKNK